MKYIICGTVVKDYVAKCFMGLINLQIHSNVTRHVSLSVVGGGRVGYLVLAGSLKNDRK
jgi:hypothetical protein